MKAVLDTNILVDYLNGVVAAKTEIARYERPLISLITWMEVLVGAEHTDDQRLLTSFLHRFQTAAIDVAVAEHAVALRRQRRVRLPDAIIWATARRHDCLLVTRNTRDFPTDDPSVRVPYRL